MPSSAWCARHTLIALPSVAATRRSKSPTSIIAFCSRVWTSIAAPSRSAPAVAAFSAVAASTREARCSTAASAAASFGSFAVASAAARRSTCARSLRTSVESPPPPPPPPLLPLGSTPTSVASCAPCDASAATRAVISSSDATLRCSLATRSRDSRVTRSTTISAIASSCLFTSRCVRPRSWVSA